MRAAYHPNRQAERLPYKVEPAFASARNPQLMALSLFLVAVKSTIPMRQEPTNAHTIFAIIGPASHHE